MLPLRYGCLHQRSVKSLQPRCSGVSVTARSKVTRSRITKKNTLAVKRSKGQSVQREGAHSFKAEEEGDIEIPKTTGLAVGLALVSTMLITAYGQYRSEQPDRLDNDKRDEKENKVNAWIRNFTLSPESAWYTPLTTLFANDSLADTLVNGYFLVYAIRGTASILSPTAACLIFMAGGSWTGNPMVVRQLRNLNKDATTVDEANNNTTNSSDVWWQTGGEGATTAVLGFLCAVIPTLRIPILGVKQLGIPLWAVAAGYIVSDSARIVWSSHEQSQQAVQGDKEEENSNIPSPLGIYGLVAGAAVWFGLVRWTSVGRRVNSEKRLIRQLLERNFGWNLRLGNKAPVTL